MMWFRGMTKMLMSILPAKKAIEEWERLCVGFFLSDSRGFRRLSQAYSCSCYHSFNVAQFSLQGFSNQRHWFIYSQRKKHFSRPPIPVSGCITNTLDDSYTFHKYVLGMISNLEVQFPGNLPGGNAWGWVWSHSLIIQLRIFIGTLLVVVATLCLDHEHCCA